MAANLSRSQRTAAGGFSRARPQYKAPAGGRTEFWTAELDSQTVLVDRRGGKILVLNPSGAVCWKIFGNGGGTREAAIGLTGAFGISLEQAEADVLSFWQMLASVTAPAPAVDNPSPGTKPPLAISLGARRFHLRCDSPALSEMIDALFAPLAKSSRSTREPDFIFGMSQSDGPQQVLSCNGLEICRDESADRLLGFLISEIADRAYPQAQWAAVVHAGAVGWDAGCAIIPAPSGRGKSLLVAGLVHSGLSFLSDDSAPLDARTGRVMPVPLALAVKESGRDTLLSRFPHLATQRVRNFAGGARRFLDLSQSAAISGLPLRLIAIPHYSPNGAGAVIPLRPMQALTALIEAGCWISPDPANGSKFFEMLASVPAFNVLYGTLDEGVFLLRQAIAGLAAGAKS